MSTALRTLLFLGLAVLLASPSSAAPDTLLAAPADAPRFELSNMRIENDQFGRTVMVFDYRRTQEGEGRVIVAGRSPEGPLQVTFLPDVTQESGEIRMAQMFGAGRNTTFNYMFYFVSPARWVGKDYGQCLVSNTVQIGNPGAGPNARPLNADEVAAYEKQKLASKPPEGVPDGYDAVYNGTTLLPGMPVMAGRYGEWALAEILTMGPDDKVTLRFRDEKQATTRERLGWLAVSPSVAATAASDPAQFKPSIRVLPGGKNALPDDAGPLPAGLELSKGVPLLLNRGSKWDQVRVSHVKGDKVNVIYPGHGGNFDWDHARHELAISRSALDELKKPGAAERFAEAMTEQAEEFGFEGDDEDEITVSYVDNYGVKQTGTYHIFDKDYPFNTRVPRGAQQLPEDLEIPAGTPVAYCWARKWRHATLLEDRGAYVLIKEDDSVVMFAYKVIREQVIVQDKSLRKIRSQQGSRIAELKKTLRTWTDSTGQHKVEARFVSVDDDAVTLKTDAGREIKLPLERLCDEDQELLKGAGDQPDNPFE